MKTVIIITAVAVLLLYLKWIVIFILYPLEALWVMYQRNKKSVVFKILAGPRWIIEKIFSGGAERYMLFNISTIPSLHIRKWLYMGLGAHIDKNVVIHFKTDIRAPHNLSLGKGTIIGDNVILDARSGLTLGENVNLSSNVSIYTLQHDHRDPNFACSTERKMSVQIDDRVWLGSNVIVLPGVHIGEGAVCCAGCVVTKDVEPFSVVAGIPAKKVGERPRNLIYEFTGKSCRLY